MTVCVGYRLLPALTVDFFTLLLFFMFYWLTEALVENFEGVKGGLYFEWLQLELTLLIDDAVDVFLDGFTNIFSLSDSIFNLIFKL